MDFRPLDHHSANMYTYLYVFIYNISHIYIYISQQEGRIQKSTIEEHQSEKESANGITCWSPAWNPCIGALLRRPWAKQLTNAVVSLDRQICNIMHTINPSYDVGCSKFQIQSIQKCKEKKTCTRAGFSTKSRPIMSILLCHERSHKPTAEQSADWVWKLFPLWLWREYHAYDIPRNHIRQSSTFLFLAISCLNPHPATMVFAQQGLPWHNQTWKRLPSACALPHTTVPATLFLDPCQTSCSGRKKTKINNGHREQGAHVLKLIAHYIEFSGVPRHALLVRKPNMLCVPCSRHHGPSHKTQSWAIMKLPHEAKTCENVLA